MIKLILFILFSIYLMPGIAYGQDSTFNLITYNIRVDYQAPGDTLNTWTKRRDHVTALLKFHKAYLFGVQEALPHQLKDIKDALEGFDWVGISRDGERVPGEYSAIFYDTALFKLLETGTFWLSETPEKPGKAWDAAFPRICTWGKFEHLPTGHSFFYFNTHFDHKGTKARAESVALLKSKINDIAGDAPTIVSGDFNFSPESQEYKKLISGKLMDAMKISETGHYGPADTYNDFDFYREPHPKIDFILLTNDFEVLRHGTLTDSFELRYPSDHLPVLAELKIRK